MTAICAKPPFVMARQTSLHHRSNQTRNRHGWRCPAERKLRLGVRQYGERYLWFESISLRHEVRAGTGDLLLRGRQYGEKIPLVRIHLSPPRIEDLILHVRLTSGRSNSRLFPEACAGRSFRSRGRDGSSAILCRFRRPVSKSVFGGTAVSDCLAGGSSVAAGASSQAARCRVALIACRVGPGQTNPSAARWARQSTGKRVSAISLFAVRSAGCLPPRIAATMSGAR